MDRYGDIGTQFTPDPPDEDGPGVSYVDLVSQRTLALRSFEELYRFTIDLSHMTPWVADRNGDIVEIHPRITDYTGLRREECLGRNIKSAIHEDDREDVVRVWRKATRTHDPLDYEFRLRAADGTYRWHRSRAAPKRDRNGAIACWFGTIEDVHDLRIANEAIRWAADHDELTGLLNRRAFVRKFADAFDTARDSKGITLLLADLDRFKSLNDLYGHDAGDELLKHVAERIARELPPTAFAGRLGGDEFAIVLEGTHSAQVSADLQQIRSIFTDTYRLTDHTHRCHVSIGVAVYPRDATTSKDLYKCADLALYEAKAGPSLIDHFNGAMRERHQRKLATLSIVRGALQRGEILPFYQPQVALRTGEIVGFEALLRWMHKSRTVEVASSIASVFQDPELAIALDNHMFERIAQDVAGWKAAGVPFGRIAINTAGVRFHADGVANELLTRIEEAGLTPASFELEITEDVLVDRNPARLAKELELLREAGMTLALDDFGTGFASLVHLKQFKIDVLKIDQSFVQNLDDPTNDAIVAAMIRLGNRLSILTVAEGVETHEQACRLFLKGCDVAQGFLYSPAAPASEVPKLLKAFARGAGDNAGSLQNWRSPNGVARR